MTLRARLLWLWVAFAVIAVVLFGFQINSLTNRSINEAMESSARTGRQVQLLLEQRITDDTANEPTRQPATQEARLARTKQTWNRIVAGDRDLAAFLVAQPAERTGVVMEINIIGEDGKVIQSSIPSRQEQPAPSIPALKSIHDAGFFDRLVAINTSQTDYESRTTLGVPEQVKPIFEIQTIVSHALLRDKIIPDISSTASFSFFALLAAAVLAGVAAQRALSEVAQIGESVDTLRTGNPLGLSVRKVDREVAAVEYKLSLLGQQIQGERRDADQMRTDFGSLARGVAHEIKNPLNAIALRLETLRMRIADDIPEAEPEIDLVSNEVQRLDRVVRTFLDLNRPAELEIREFDPVEMASEVSETMRPAATQAGADLQLARPVMPFAVRADRGLIEQALLNVINNAIQAMRGIDGKRLVKIVVSLTAGNCEIAVIDNGPGMPVSVRDRIFEPYFTTKESGSGIGLALTKRAMELHRGRVIVESSPGHGTTMLLTFPANPIPMGRSAGA